jgi:lipopolysaccharide/colanic/teichoic acid biosynthesis glycosyltransferase
LLLAAAPLVVVIAPLIKLDSPGPIFYTQERVGVNRRRNRHRRQDPIAVTGELRIQERRQQPADGRPFHIVKFRTMVADAEKATGPTWAAPNDPRVTRIGRILRPARLDELPQLWNVLRGQMSLVGPRPERPHFVSQFVRQIPGYRTRLEAVPGITGLAQVENAYDSSEADVRRKLDYDLEYIRRSSIREDLWILLRTMVVMLTGRGSR